MIPKVLPTLTTKRCSLISADKCLKLVRMNLIIQKMCMGQTIIKSTKKPGPIGKIF